MYLGIDLGSTNIKAALYDADMNLIDRKSIPVSYIRENGFVEFDAQKYAENLIDLLSELLFANKVDSVSEIASNADKDARSNIKTKEKISELEKNNGIIYDKILLLKIC